MKCNKTIIDVSGYMFSGKSAVSDLLREFDSLEVPHYDQEFDLIRTPYGLGDFLFAIESRSQIKINHALYKYLKLINVKAFPPNFYSKFWSYGGWLEKDYPDILNKTKKFINEITDFEWEQASPFFECEARPLEIFYNKLRQQFTGDFPWPKFIYKSINPENFFLAVKPYLLSIINPNNSNKAHVIHNALEPIRPSIYFDLFEKIKCIIVDRDPRDIFMTANQFSKGYNNNLEVYKRISGAHNIDFFIDKQIKMRQSLDKSENILRINFEDLVLDYENTLITIMKFLELNKSNHKRKLQYFSPQSSIQNIQLWKKDHSKIQEIIKIERSMPSYCRL
jgi:hypothetical protein